ncbi:G-type lectin S-receptor-like serine/threonine-protein kinase SD2-5 [Triticum aestivum]|uniref:G-type lectin S-receptor-like serine/threonine-protein kinase SD2-5 n=1 Tax=Triticum aestivum TaxID=4565 RepID=UPI001D021337|nr:G-type lectin S-receptor-like serine/threonine-protein kinase SD2-5 [Triticum aestivum]
MAAGPLMPSCLSAAQTPCKAAESSLLNLPLPNPFLPPRLQTNSSACLPPSRSDNPPPSFDDDFNKQVSRTTNSFLTIIVVVSVLSILGSVAIAYFLYKCVKKNVLPAININTTSPAPAGSTTLYAVVPDSQIRDATVERFLKEIAVEKPIRFTPQHLSGFTNKYSARLGAGGFGAIYKGMLPNGLMVAVKHLHPGQDDRTSQEQFMAEVGTIGRTHHINLVRLFGFCYEADVRALAGATEKCDVYSFGILLFEILGRRRNFDEAAPESQQWFPKLAWTKYESGELMEVVASSNDACEEDKRAAHRMCEVAFWCVQQQPKARPPMSVVVKMLEGEMDIAPPANPFQHLMATPAAANLWATGTSTVNSVSSSANGVPRGSDEIV